MQLCDLDDLIQLTSKSGVVQPTNRGNNCLDLLKLLVVLVQSKLHPYLLLPIVASRVHE